MNTDQEKFAFEIFLELHGKLPTGVKTEAPDFTIKHDGKKIGVELIELLEPAYQKTSSAAKYSLEDKIAKSAQRQYDLISDKKLMVNLQIVENLDFPLSKIDSLSSQISDTLLNVIKDKPYCLSHNFEIN